MSRTPGRSFLLRILLSYSYVDSNRTLTDETNAEPTKQGLLNHALSTTQTALYHQPSGRGLQRHIPGKRLDYNGKRRCERGKAVEFDLENVLLQAAQVGYAYEVDRHEVGLEGRDKATRVDRILGA